MTIYNCPPMSWAEFLSIPDGTQVWNHGDAQCVALANQYNEGVLGGGFVSVDTALDWWTNGNVSNVHGFHRIGDNPQVGDIFIASCEIYNCSAGHIGVVVRAWDGNTFGTMEQNVHGKWVSRHDRTMANVDGFLRPINQAPLAPPAPALGVNQRVAGANGVNRRADASSQSELLEPHLEAGEVGNFLNWRHGENIAGNDIWFQGVSGNWFWSGAFTSQSVDGLNDVTPVAPVAPVVPEVTVPETSVDPAPSVPEETVEPEPVTPAPTTSAKPEQVEHRPRPTTKPSKETTVASFTPLTEQQIADINNRITASEDAAEAGEHDLVSLGFWNYAGERVIKTFAMTASAILTTTGAVVITQPETANVFASIGWVYLASVAGVSALNSLLVALSSFKNIVTIKK